MKLSALIGLIGVTSAQLDVCASTEECLAGFEGRYTEGSCCNTWTIAALPEDPTWGQFAAAWGGEAKIVVGESFTACAYPAYVAQSAKEVDENG